MQKVKEIIAEAGRRVGVDPRIMQIMAAIESSFNPMAKAKTSSATGLFQFINSTWKEMTQKVGAKYGISANSDRTDAMTNSLMGAEFLKGNANTIKKVKPNPSVTDLYIAHFLGPGGAQQFLKSSPDTIGAEVFPKPAKANPSIFRADGGKGGYLSIGQIYQNFENKLKRLAASYGIEFPTSGTNMTTGNPPKPMEEGPKEPPPLATVGTTPPGSSAFSAAPSQGSSTNANTGTANAPSTQAADPNTTQGVATGQPNASGASFDGISFNDRNGKEKLGQIHPKVLSQFTGMAKEFTDATGKNVVVNESFRTREDQARMKEKYGDGAAKPGSSTHEFGLAIDINTPEANKLDDMGLMKKYGFTRPIGAETWHLEPAGVAVDPQGAKADPNKREKAIDSSPGRGGGGLGTVPGSRKGGRDIKLQEKIFANGSDAKGGGQPSGSNTMQEFTPPDTMPKGGTASTSSPNQQNTIPGITKPTATAEQAVEVKPEPKKKYPWVIDERPDDLAVGRKSNTSKSGEALYGAMDGVKSTMSQQLIVSTEMRDVLKDRVAPALEKMLEVLAGAKSAAPATTPTPPSKVAPTPVRPATQSFLDLKRMA